ncbi:tetratricopeptide repeat protein [Oxalobacteraceae bacterium A2-2]
MFKSSVSLALMFTLAPAGAQTAPTEAEAASQVVRITGAKQTPTGESARVYAAKQSALKGTLAIKCGLDSDYLSDDDAVDASLQQREDAVVAGEIADPTGPRPLNKPRKFSGSAPVNDVVNMDESSSITGTVGSSGGMGPCSDGDRKSASAREYIIRKDKTFAEAVAAYEAKDYPRAATLLQAAYRKIAYPEAAVLLGKMSLEGQGLPRDTAKALDWFDRAAVGRFDAGRQPLRFNPKDPEAFNGMIEGALMLARIHLSGVAGVKKDPAEGRKWYAKAAELGYVPALNALGLASQKGIGGPRDLKQAQAYFKEAAERGYAPAQYNLAQLYYAGSDTIPRDYAQARTWYANAAVAGHSGALYALARMVDLGQGGPSDQKKAFAYYKEAALRGEPGAQSALALYYYEGEQVPKDLAIARKLFTEAAMRGQTEAMFNLAVMSTNGEGGARDLGMAYVWFSLAKANGHQKAAQAMDDVAHDMSSQDRATADAILKPRAVSQVRAGG